jgi:porin
MTWYRDAQARRRRAAPTPAQPSARRERRRDPLAAIIATGLLLAHVQARPADRPDAAAPPPAPPAWHWAGICKLDLLTVDAPRYSSGVGNLGLRVDADAARLFGWHDTALRVEALWNHGGKPNRRVGSAQGVSNLEVVENAARLYATWVEHRVRGSDTRVLFGLYDLNSEFYTTDASGLLIHPSFGIGIDFSQSGTNGPSIFPNLGLTLRVRQPLSRNGHYLQAALIDAASGDPAHPGRTVVQPSAANGALLVAEWGWQQPGSDGPGPGHWGIGVWRYTRPVDRIDGSPPVANQGAYALVQTVLAERSAGRTTAFLRGGVANAKINPVDRAFDAGVLVEHPFGAQGPIAFTAGIAVARFGAAQRATHARQGRAVTATETALEAGLRWRLRPALAAQPVVQRIRHPGGRDVSATVVGVRVEWTLGPGDTETAR